jgi:hypothetical protein
VTWKKGQSGNPRGRPKKDWDAVEMAREHGADAIQALVDNLKDESGSVRNVAALGLLDRGYGKPAQTNNVNVTRDDVRHLTGRDLDLAISEALAREEAPKRGSGLAH